MAQHDHSDEFPFQPPKEMILITGLGSLHHPTSTKNAEAQQFFDQGLTLIYAFNHDAAYWSFQRATQLDPEFAMAYWGMALAVGPNINMDITSGREKNAYENIQKALKLTSGIAENERDYIEALSKRYSNDLSMNLPQLAKDYNQAMLLVKQKYPDDLDAAVLYAESGMDLRPWNLWTIEGKPEEGTLEIVNVLETVLKKDPMHIGANHYYIHAIEASSYPERALMSATRLKGLLPASGHLLHMPGHIYLLVGDYHEAAEVNEAAVKADRAYIKEFGLDGIYPLHYLSHNLYFLIRAYNMLGRYEDAKRVADELSQFYTPYFEKMPDLEYYIPSSMFVMMQFHQWKKLLALPPPPEEAKIASALYHFGRAIAFASLGNMNDALEEQKIFNEQKGAVGKCINYGYNTAETILKLAYLVLEAKIAEKDNRSAQAIAFFKQAIEVQDHLHYNEPSDWYFPIRESLGGLLLREKLFIEAEKVFREDLEKHPRNGRSLFGLLQTLKGQSRTTDAWWINQEFTKAWQYSPSPLTLEDL